MSMTLQKLPLEFDSSISTLVYFVIPKIKIMRNANAFGNHIPAGTYSSSQARVILAPGRGIARIINVLAHIQ